MKLCIFLSTSFFAFNKLLCIWGRSFHQYPMICYRVFQESFNLSGKRVTTWHFCYSALAFVTVLFCLWDELLYVIHMTAAASLLFWCTTSKKIKKMLITFYWQDFYWNKLGIKMERKGEKLLFSLFFPFKKIEKDRGKWKSQGLWEGKECSYLFSAGNTVCTAMKCLWSLLLQTPAGEKSKHHADVQN